VEQLTGIQKELEKANSEANFIITDNISEDENKIDIDIIN
jgi:hypothetical protein